MGKKHTVGPGECISSIGFEYGFFPGTIWEHPANAELRALRKNLHVLDVGDVVEIPDLRVGSMEVATEARHVFRRRGVPDRLRLRFLRDDTPRANEAYVLTIDGKEFKGVTDADGVIDRPLSPSARKAHLLLGEDEFNFELRDLAPVTNPAGQRARLVNLGLLDADAAPGDAEALRAALSSFQSQQGLPPNGEADAATQDALIKAHGA